MREKKLEEEFDKAKQVFKEQGLYKGELYEQLHRTA